MKKKRWRVKTHACVKFREHPGQYGLGPTLTVCVKCGRVKNWCDVFPVGR